MSLDNLQLRGRLWARPLRAACRGAISADHRNAGGSDYKTAADVGLPLPNPRTHLVSVEPDPKTRGVLADTITEIEDVEDQRSKLLQQGVGKENPGLSNALGLRILGLKMRLSMLGIHPELPRSVREGEDAPKRKRAGRPDKDAAILEIAREWPGLGKIGEVVRRVIQRRDCGPSPAPARGAPVSWKRIVLEKVSGHEGGFTSLNLNRDNAGLSVGIIQWAQAPGQLGVLLNAQYRAAPELFIRHFGGPTTARELRDVANASTQAARMKPVGGHWKEPWISSVRAAQAEPRFQDVQVELATSGEHWQAAMYASELWGWATVRSLTVLYDRTVQQGAGFVKGHAKKVHEQLGPDAPPNQGLAALRDHRLRPLPPELYARRYRQGRWLVPP